MSESSYQLTPAPLFVTEEPTPEALYITLGPDQQVKMGTCQHCVVFELTRPARAWDATGDSELDFARDVLLGYLEELGVRIIERHAYVCP
jgi:hypothetical protein